MSRTPLTDAMIDSHKVTMALHVEAAERAFNEGNWSGAVTAYQLALPHANATHDRDLKRLVFGALNRARAKLKLEARNAKKPEAYWYDENGVEHSGSLEQMGEHFANAQKKKGNVAA